MTEEYKGLKWIVYNGDKTVMYIESTDKWIRVND